MISTSIIHLASLIVKSLCVRVFKAKLALKNLTLFLDPMTALPNPPLHQ